MKSLESIFSYVSGRTLEKRYSEINGELEVCYQFGRRVLHSENANYSYDSLHKLFQNAFKSIDLRNRKIRRVLILGFGAGSVASILLYEYKLNVKVTGVERDSIVLELGRKYFDIDKMPNLTIVEDDARNFVKSTGQYDLIIHDVFVDRDVPSALIDQEYVQSLIKCTSNNGIGLYNFIVANKEQEEAWSSLYQSFSHCDTSLSVKKFSGINKMLIWEKTTSR
jgi:precorrin-6B methylase 2